ncbi:MAG: hypothetical protein PVI01_15360 [Gemmatimonadales bacterium]
MEAIQKDRIRDALARPIDGHEVTKKWAEMKKATAWPEKVAAMEDLKMMLSDLRGASLANLEMEHLLLLSDLAAVLAHQYKRYKIPAPEWLDRRADEIDRAIKSQRRTALESKVSELIEAQEKLKSTEQKRADVEAQLAAVKAALDASD